MEFQYSEKKKVKPLNLRNILHSINLRKLTIPAALCLSALLILTMLSAFSSTSDKATTAAPLRSARSSQHPNYSAPDDPAGTLSRTMSLYVNYTATPLDYAPTFATTVYYNATRGGETSLFSIDIIDWTNIQGYIFSTNATGSMVNSTYTTLSGSPTSVTINSTAVMPSLGNSLQIQWFANGTDGTWGSSPTFTYLSYSVAGGTYVAGNQLFYPNGTVLTLTGMVYTYFLDSEGGSWMYPDGSVHWLTDPMDTTGVADLLDFTEACNCNVIRLHLTVQYWLDNLDNYQSNLEYFITQAANKGIYIDFEFFADSFNSTSYTFSGDLWLGGNGVLNSTADFVNLWGNTSTILKNYPNVIFELWNEPSPPDAPEATWMNVTEQCIDRIRSTGAIQPINVMWNQAIYYDFGDGYTGVGGAGRTMNWVTDYPLNDPCGNLIYSTHIYRNDFFNSSNGYQQIYSYFDMNYALTYCGVYGVAQNHPLVIFEIGANLWASDPTNETNWLNNTLTCLDQHGIGYAYFAAPPWRSGAQQWGLVTENPDFTLDAAGVVFIAHTGGMNYTDWLTLQQPTPTPSPTPTPTPSPTPTPTPSPTPTPTSLQTPTSTSTPTPVTTPVSTPTLSASPTPLTTAPIGGVSTDTAIIIASAVVLVIVTISFGAYAYTKRSKK